MVASETEKQHDKDISRFFDRKWIQRKSVKSTTQPERKSHKRSKKWLLTHLVQSMSYYNSWDFPI